MDHFYSQEKSCLKPNGIDGFNSLFQKQASPIFPL